MGGPLLDWGYAGTGAWIKVMGEPICDETRWCIIHVYLAFCAVALFLYANVTAYMKAFREEQELEQTTCEAPALAPAKKPAAAAEWSKLD